MFDFNCQIKAKHKLTDNKLKDLRTLSKGQTKAYQLSDLTSKELTGGTVMRHNRDTERQEPAQPSALCTIFSVKLLKKFTKTNRFICSIVDLRILISSASACCSCCQPVKP